jgi:FtsH-binding integral membrane protein
MKTSRLSNFSSLIYKKRHLLKCVFSTLLFQACVTTLVVYYLNKEKVINLENYNLLFSFMILIVVILLIFIIMVVKSFRIQFILFTIFSITQGIFLSLLPTYLSYEVIISALFSVISVFILFIIFGIITVYFRTDLSWMGIILFLFLLFMIVLNIVSIFIPQTEEQKKKFTILAIMLFSSYITYDTNILLLKDENMDCISGALTYYIDLINLFGSIIPYDNLKK